MQTVHLTTAVLVRAHEGQPQRGEALAELLPQRLGPPRGVRGDAGPRCKLAAVRCGWDLLARCCGDCGCGAARSRSRGGGARRSCADEVVARGLGGVAGADKASCAAGRPLLWGCRRQSGQPRGRHEGITRRRHADAERTAAQAFSHA